MHLIPLRQPVLACGLGVALYAVMLAGAFSSTIHARQGRTATDAVYTGEQARRGQQLYDAQCASCHGQSLEGVVGPPLAGDAFLSAWSGRSLTEVVDKIEKTMPLGEPGSLSRQQSIDVAAYMLQAGKFPAGSSELTPATLGQVALPRAAAAPAAAAGSAPARPPVANMAQYMRAITFPNANIVFNVQVKDPGVEKPKPPVPFDYVLWGSTVYYGWQAVDQAALALIESTPQFLVPGRRCENGRPAPVDRADWKKYTEDLVAVGHEVYKASQSRNVDAVVKMADRLNDACANCHKVYRDGAAEGQGRGAERCQ